MRDLWHGLTDGERSADYRVQPPSTPLHHVPRYLGMAAPVVKRAGASRYDIGMVGRDQRQMVEAGCLVQGEALAGREWGPAALVAKLIVRAELDAGH